MNLIDFNLECSRQLFKEKHFLKKKVKALDFQISHQVQAQEKSLFQGNK